MLNVVCVQTGNYLGLGREYVANLRRAVEKHLTVPHRFVVVTDDDPASYEGEVVRSKHAGWWEKLRIFERGLFEGRVMFLDLDTVIVGNIDHLAEYDGPFATLEDFWRPGRLGPAVMLYDAAYAATFYEEWAAEGFPKVGNGDQTWLENRDQGRFRKSVDFLQRLFPGTFVSYKEHCTSARRGWRDVQDQIAAPAGARVVCFHGRPRPHEVGGWVKDYWHTMEVAHG